MPAYTAGMKKNWGRLKALQEANRVKKLNEEYNQIVKTETVNAEAPENSGGFFSSITEKIFGGDENRKRTAASKNNISNKQLNDMLQKNISKKEAKNLQQYGKTSLSNNLSHLTGKNVDAGGEEIGIKKEDVANFEEMQRLDAEINPLRRSFEEDSDEGLLAKRFRILSDLIKGEKSEDDPESIPRNAGGDPGMEDYGDEVVKKTQPVPKPVPELVPKPVPKPVPKQGPPQLGDDGFAQSEKSYEDYRENVQSQPYTSEGEAKGDPKGMFNLGAEDVGDDGFAQSEESYDEENAVRSDMKHLTKTIIEGTPEEKKEAKEFRKEAFAHLSPRETALAKEETGNYWIDPISGVAINIDMIQADGKRKSNWLMLEKLPEHARPYFMAKFGYLDAEDVDGMPIDPKLKIAEMNMQAKKLELESLERRHTESTGVQYAQITGKSALQAANLKWDREKYNSLSAYQKEQVQVQQYNQIRSDVDLMFKNGQYESGMLLAQGLNIPYVMDPIGFWKSKAKVSAQNPVFTKALVGAQLENMTAKTAGTKYNDKKGYYWNKLNEPVSEPGMGKVSYFESKANLHGIRLWDQLNDAERAKAGSAMAWNNSQRSKVFNELLLNDPVFKHLHKNLNDARTAAALGDRGDGGTGTGTDKPKVVPKKEDKKEISDKLNPDKKDPKLLTAISPVEELKDIDTKYEFGAGKYTAELAGKILGLGKWDYDQYDSFMEYRNSKEGLREISKKNLGPGKVKKKLERAYNTGKKGFEKILAKEKKSNNPRFTSIKEAAVYYNKKSGIFFDRREGHELRNDVKYYISRNLK